MSDTQRRIEEIEARAAESDLIGSLAMDDDVRVYNRRLAVELREFAAKLRTPVKEAA